MRRHALALLVVLVVLGALFGAAQATRPDRAERSGAAAVEHVPVVGASAICPAVRQGPALSTSASVGAAPGGDGPPVPGRLTATVLTAGPPAPLAATLPGQVVYGIGSAVKDDAVLLEGSGSLAAGLEVEQLGRGNAGADRGLAGLRCSSPTTDQWLVGGATGPGDDSVLLLVNGDSTPAVVDVQLFHEHGASDPAPGRGLVVPPGGRLSVPLSRLAPDHQDIVTHVVASRGRVAAAVLYRKTQGSIPQGTEWAAAASGPQPTVVVPGLPAGPGYRGLIVTNPGEQDTRVSIQLTTSDGQFVPPGLEAVDVPSGTSVPVDLSSQLAGTSAAVRVTSQGGAAAPVVAGGLVVDAQPGLTDRDFAYAAAGEPLGGPALLTELALDQPTESALIISALDGDASVTVTAFQPLAAKAAPLGPPRTVLVPGGSTQVLALSTFLPPGTQARFAVEIRPAAGSGPVYVARYLRTRDSNGPMSTLLTLQSAAREVERPAVRSDPAVDRR